MTYNLLYGAGVNPSLDDHVPLRFRKNRLELVLQIIGEVHPDILGLQEAASWQTGSPPVVEQVAERLGMPFYYLARDWDGNLSTAILSKHPIAESENLVGIGVARLLRARIETPDGQTLEVFVLHANPKDSAVRMCEFQKVAKELRAFPDERLIVMGDMNAPSDHVWMYLKPAGMRLVGIHWIDQIWMNQRPLDEWKGISVTMPYGTYDASDHLPVAADIRFYPRSIAPSATAAPAESPTPPPDYCK